MTAPAHWGPLTRTGPTHWMRAYESLRDIVAHCRTLGAPRRNDVTNDHWRFGSHFDTAESTLSALEEGRTTPTIKRLSNDLRGRIVHAMEAGDTTGISARRRHVYREEGDEIDTDRMLAKRDDPWRVSVKGRQVRMIRLGINTWTTCNNQEKDFANLVGTACAIADTLCTMGHAVEIVGLLAGHATRDSGGSYTYPYRHTYRFTVKKADEPLDLERVGALGLPGLLRWVGFVLQDLDDPTHGRTRGPAYLDNAKHLKEACEIDCLITRSWLDDGEATVLDGIREILST